MYLSEISIYRNIIEAIDYPVVIIDSNKVIVSCNSDFEVVFGCKEGVLDDVSPVFGNSSFKTILEQSISERQSKRLYRNYQTEKSNFDYDIRINHIRNTHLYIVTLIDISSKSQIRKEFNLLFENSHAMIAVINREMQVIRANQKFRVIFGENFNYKFYELYGRRKSDLPVMPVYRCFQSKEGQINPQTVIASNGTKVNMLTAAIPFSIKDGEVNTVIEISTDVTEISKMQEQLNGINDDFHTILNMCHDGIIVMHNSDKLGLMNKAAKEILGLDRQRKPGLKTVRSIFPKYILEAERLNDENTSIVLSSRRKEEVGVSSQKLSVPQSKAIIFQKQITEDSVGHKNNVGKVHTALSEVKEELDRKLTEQRSWLIHSSPNEIDSINNTDIKDIYRNTVILLSGFDSINRIFSKQAESVNKKRTNIKISTLSKKMEYENKIIQEKYGIDIRIIHDYVPKISVNTGIITSCIYMILHGCACDIFSDYSIKGTIKIKFTADDSAHPFILIEDNFLEAKEEISEPEVLRIALDAAAPLLDFTKSKLSAKSSPFVGRSIKITLP